MTRSTRSWSVVSFSFSGAESSAAAAAASPGESTAGGLTAREGDATYKVNNHSFNDLRSIYRFLSRYLALFIGGSTGRGIRGLDVGGFLQLDFLSARATPIGEGHILFFSVFFFFVFSLSDWFLMDGGTNNGSM